MNYLTQLSKLRHKRQAKEASAVFDLFFSDKGMRLKGWDDYSEQVIKDVQKAHEENFETDQEMASRFWTF